MRIARRWLIGLALGLGLAAIPAADRKSVV